MSTFAERIGVVMRARKISAADLVRRLGCSSGTVSACYMGKASRSVARSMRWQAFWVCLPSGWNPARLRVCPAYLWKTTRRC